MTDETTAATPEGGGTRTIPYEFSRGDANKQEDSWTCMGRLAEEVQWRRFVRGGELWYVSEEWLDKQPVVYRLSEEARGVLQMSFNFETRIDATECTVKAQARRYAVLPGQAVRLNDEGPADGSWLVAAVRRDLQDAVDELKLVRRRPKLPEPAPRVETVNVGGTEQSIAASGDQRAGSIEELSNKVRQAVPGLQVTSTFRPGGTSFHAQKRAHDLSASTDLMDKGADFILQSGLWQSLVEGIYNSGGRGHDLSVKNNAKVPPSFWGGGTWGMHANHLHLAV